MDTISKEKRSWNMSHIRGANTKIELIIRKALFAKGYRYRINTRILPGKPDIVFRKYKTVIFINGCFWHGHRKCKAGRLPKSRTSYWRDKIQNNIKRDSKNIRLLRMNGWRVKIVWECQIKKNPDSVIKRLDKYLLGAVQ